MTFHLEGVNKPRRTRLSLLCPLPLELHQTLPSRIQTTRRCHGSLRRLPERVACPGQLRKRASQCLPQTGYLVVGRRHSSRWHLRCRPGMVKRRAEQLVRGRPVSVGGMESCRAKRQGKGRRIYRLSCGAGECNPACMEGLMDTCEGLAAEGRPEVSVLAYTTDADS